MWKKLASGVCALALGITCVASAMPPLTRAEATVPWNENAAWPTLSALSTATPGTTYFSGKEWTGEVKSTNAQGKNVRQSDVFGVNREEAHATDTIPYDSVENAKRGAIEGEFTKSPYYRLLTGKDQPWDLTVYKNLSDATAAGVTDNFYKSTFDGVTPYTGSNQVQDYSHADYGCGWKSVELPASWQTQGFDFPIYSNINTPWKGVYGNEGAGIADKDLVPTVPTVTNPVGFYRRQFTVDADWLANGRRVFISFQGVESAMYLYVNGHEVGYTEDSYDAHDFDITPYLHTDGSENLLAVRVHRWSDGSWLEDQDVLRLGGIFRDVFLYTTPAVYLRDYKVETDLDAKFVDADLKLDIQIENRSAAEAAGYCVDVQVFDADGKNIFADEPLRGELSAVASGKEGTLSLNRHVSAPHLWSDEDPYLYTMVISLYEKTSGKLFQCVSQQLGFREITFTKTKVNANYDNITDKYEPMLLNGKPLLFRGVNRHDNDPFTGKYVSRERYEQDIRIMKQNNINAVRTSHYPDDRYFYYLCDKYGILVMAETNMETHSLQNDSDVMASYFERAYRDRLTANIQAQKNRASVVMWSLGNECGNTPGTKMFQKAIQQVIRKLDSTRPVHYEGLGGSGGVDVFSNMYPGHGTLDDRGHDQNRMPYVMCEYVFSQGNTTADVKEYWDRIRKYDNLIGGFTWDFVDKTIATPLSAQMVLDVDEGPLGCKLGLKGELAANERWGHVLTNGYATVNTNNTVDETLSGRHPFTMEMWVNPHGSGEYESLMAKSDHQVSLRSYRNERLDVVFFSGGNWQVANFRLPAKWLNNWHHLAVTFNGTKVAMWCDGAPLAASNAITITSDIASSSYELAINYDTETGRSGDNEVAYARLYDRVLTDEELSAQGAADEGNGDYAVAPTDDAVVLWLDFAHYTDDDYHLDTDSTWDYYAEIGSEEMAGKYFAYGGDWGDVINDGSFMDDGLVFADRTVEPAMQEIAYFHQPVWFTASEKQLADHQVSIQNEFRFADTSRYDLKWELMEDGAVIQSGVLDVTVAAGDTVTATVPFTLPETPKAGGEYFLNLRAVQREEANFVEAGRVMAHEQFALPANTAKVAAVDPSAQPAIATVEENGVLTLTGRDFTLTFDRETGAISSYVYKGQTVLTAGPVSNYWRAQMDSDTQSTEWRSGGRGRKVQEFTYHAQNGAVIVDVSWTLPSAGKSTERYRYIVYGSGEIRVEATLSPDAKTGELLKYGAEVTLPRGYENITFYGDGPEETYADRRHGAEIGVYETTVSGSFLPFVRPQTSGNHTAVRYMTLEEEGNPVGLAVVGEQPIEASALHYRVSDYAGCNHPYEMPKTDYTILNVDMVSAGLGSNLGPATLDQYRLYTDHDYHYAYTLMPYDVGDDVMERSKAWRADTADLPEWSDTPDTPDTPDDPIIWGDANRDNEVTTADARQILQFAAELVGEDEVDMIAADVNKDDNVTTADARVILQYCAELVDKLPVEAE